MPWNLTSSSLYGMDTEAFESDSANSRISKIVFNTHKKNNSLTVVVFFSTDELAKQHRNLFLDAGFKPANILVSGSAITLQDIEARKVVVLSLLKAVDSNVSEINAMLGPIENPDSNRLFSGSSGASSEASAAEEKPFQPPH